MTESTYNLSRKESKRWQNVNTQLLTILTVGIYRTHLYLLRFFHPFNPYNPCSIYRGVFFRTRIYRIDADKISIYQNTEIYFSMFFPYFYLLMFYQCGTVFQTAFLTTCYNPETSSRVTLASLGIGFQPNLAGFL